MLPDGPQVQSPECKQSQSTAETVTHATTHILHHFWRGASLTRHVGKATTDGPTPPSALPSSHQDSSTRDSEGMGAFTSIYTHNPGLSHIKYICVNVYNYVCLNNCEFLSI